MSPCSRKCLLKIEKYGVKCWVSFGGIVNLLLEIRENLGVYCDLFWSSIEIEKVCFCVPGTKLIFCWVVFGRICLIHWSEISGDICRLGRGFWRALGGGVWLLVFTMELNRWSLYERELECRCSSMEVWMLSNPRDGFLRFWRGEWNSWRGICWSYGWYLSWESALIRFQFWLYRNDCRNFYLRRYRRNNLLIRWLCLEERK